MAGVVHGKFNPLVGIFVVYPAIHIIKIIACALNIQHSKNQIEKKKLCFLFPLYIPYAQAMRQMVGMIQRNQRCEKYITGDKVYSGMSPNTFPIDHDGKFVIDSIRKTPAVTIGDSANIIKFAGRVFIL